MWCWDENAIFFVAVPRRSCSHLCPFSLVCVDMFVNRVLSHEMDFPESRQEESGNNQEAIKILAQIQTGGSNFILFSKSPSWFGVFGVEMEITHFIRYTYLLGMWRYQNLTVQFWIFLRGGAQSMMRTHGPRVAVVPTSLRCFFVKGRPIVRSRHMLTVSRHFYHHDTKNVTMPSLFSSEWPHHPSSPLPGAPVVASFPHFYLAESKYIEGIGGMSPQAEHHQTFLDLNPVGRHAAFPQLEKHFGV